MIRIRGGSGLGDSIYVRPVCEHFMRKGKQVTALSNFPDIFIGSGARVEPFTRDSVNVLAHYTAGKANTRTTQWQDILNSARITEQLPLRFSWGLQNRQLWNYIRGKANGRPVVLASGGRAPMNRDDGFGIELLPEASAFHAALSAFEHCFVVAVGNATPIYQIPCHENMNGKTSIAELLDLGSMCDAIVGQCSFVIPLAEVFDKPLLTIWSQRGLDARHPYVKQITPQKVLSSARDRYVIDSHGAERIKAEASAFVDEFMCLERA